MVSKNNFFVPKFAPNLLILQLASLNSMKSEIDIRKLLFLDRLLTEPKMTFVVNSLFQSRAASYFDPNIKSIGVLPSICDTLCKYKLFIYFETWFHNYIFPCYEEWKYCELIFFFCFQIYISPPFHLSCSQK